MAATPQSPSAIGNNRYMTATNAETGITAFAGGGQSSATQLTAQMNHIGTCATAGDSVALPKAGSFQPGDARLGGIGNMVLIHNRGAASCQVYGKTPDTVNGIATATGIPLPPNGWIIAWLSSYNATTNVGTWVAAVVQDVLGTGLVTTGGITPSTAIAGFRNFQPVAATSGTDTAFASGTLFVSSIFIPANKTLTGIGFLLGSVGGTDKVVVQLNSASGALLANSTLTGSGTTAGTAAQTQKIDFTSTYAAVGPAMYFIGVSANGNTAKLRTVPAFTGVELFAASLAQTAATPAAIVAPTTFTADTAPIAFVY